MPMYAPAPGAVMYDQDQYSVAQIILPAGNWTSIDGLLTLGTALPYLPTGIVLVYLAASGISPEQWYYATFSSVTDCQVWTNRGGTTKPATVVGAYTPVLTEINFPGSVALPANSIGNHGQFTTEHAFTGSTGAISRTKWGGSTIYQYTHAQLSMADRRIVQNRGVHNSQFLLASAGQYGGFGAGGLSQYLSVATNAVTTVTFTGQLTATTDYCIMERYKVSVTRSNRG